jgi:excisionase family DNA binding protein
MKTQFIENQKEVLNAKEAAAFLGVSAKTVYEKALDGILPHQRLGSRYIFLRSELIRFLKGE